MQRLSEQYFPANIEDLPIPFFGISSDLGMATVNVHERGPVWESTCASAALPGIMPPWVFEQNLTVDGCILNNLPVDVMQQKPVRWIVAVDLSSPAKHFRVDYSTVPSPWEVIRGRLPLGRRRRRVLDIASTMLKAMEMGSQSRVAELGARADLLLRPPVQQFNILEVDQYDRVVDAGYRYGKKQIGEWLAGGRAPLPAASD